MINIAIVTYNRVGLTQIALQSLAKFAPKGICDINVIDNGSTDSTPEYLKYAQSENNIKNVILLDNNIGVAKASNILWQLEGYDHYVKYDNDIMVTQGNWLSQMVELAEQIPNAGSVSYNFSPFPLENAEYMGKRFKKTEFGKGCGACVLIPNSTREKLGYWCEDYGVYGEEDRDYIYRINKIGLINVVPFDNTVVTHLQNYTDSKINSNTETDAFELEYRHIKDVCVADARKKQSDILKKYDENIYVKPSISLQDVEQYIYRGK
jgi:GT2 family glycosyltransferase